MPKKILIVDDEPDILKVVTIRLKKLGYEVLTAKDGNEGLNLTRAKRPDLIFLDLRMPGINGYEVCETIKSDGELKSIPIILLTASTGMADPEKAKVCKADDCLIKPFEPEELLEKVKKFLG